MLITPDAVVTENGSFPSMATSRMCGQLIMGGWLLGWLIAGVVDCRGCCCVDVVAAAVNGVVVVSVVANVGMKHESHFAGYWMESQLGQWWRKQRNMHYKIETVSLDLHDPEQSSLASDKITTIINNCKRLTGVLDALFANVREIETGAKGRFKWQCESNLSIGKP